MLMMIIPLPYVLSFRGGGGGGGGGNFKSKKKKCLSTEAFCPSYKANTLATAPGLQHKMM